MAHIISCMLDSDSDDIAAGLHNYIAKTVSPQTSNESLGRESPSGDKPFIWRMMHQAERKYQLFPKDKQPPATPGKSLDPEQAFALAMGQNGDKGDKTTPGTGLRIRIKEHNLIRRRKVSVPELGPMTTVQEVAMDSPTIPGRPPIHERSISAPGPSWKQHQFAESICLQRCQTPDERAELDVAKETIIQDRRPQNELRQPLSPKNLAPLVIPTTNPSGPRLSRLRSGSTPVEPTLRSARTDDSPMARTPYTPLSALTTPRSAAMSTMTTSTLPTPVSAPIECRSSPRPWERMANNSQAGTPKENTATGPDPFSTPKAEPAETPQSSSTIGHRRNRSESASIMERGRPRKRNDSTGGTVLKRTGSKRSKSAERRAFEQLPKGWKASDAANMLSPTEMASVHKQALQQAARFEVLRKEDVDNLSRELRQLDERTDYLRRTYTSLRAGRRNLHTRICQYLRSPRTAKFSHESMLKQEESLAELDASIDDWVMKLEQADNRRTRVRQKLLEHVAAAATLTVPTGGVVEVSESLQHAMGVRPLNSSNGAGNISTPPRSPSKTIFTSHTYSSSPSPQRVVAQVPSTILEHPLFEEAASSAGDATNAKEDAATTLRRAETIRIYADNDVYALLADVENAITKMSAGDFSTSNEEPWTDSERKKVHRAHSHEVLNGSAKGSSSSSSSSDEKPSPISSCATSAASTPPPVPEKAGAQIFLTSAVFKP